MVRRPGTGTRLGRDAGAKRARAASLSARRHERHLDSTLVSQMVHAHPSMKLVYRIPFNRPTQSPNDADYISEALAGGHLSGDGPFTKRCHRILEEVACAPKALLTTSCTHALEMAAFLLEIQPGDE